MNALEHNRFSDAWQAFGAAMPQPKAILCISAHWYVGATAVTAMAHPKTIHDFGGFPSELFAVEYPAPGAPEVAGEIVELLKPTEVISDQGQWGLDHGTWSVLVHAYPKADVPVLQLAIDARQPFECHVNLGAALAPLRDKGVLILGSGNVVHNLRRLAWHEPDAAFDWNRRFDDAAKEIMVSKPDEVLRLADHPDFRMAAPTPDHFIPLLYIAGLAAAAGEASQPFIEGYSMGALSMTSYKLA